MARPVRKKLKFDEDSLNDYLQEIYNDSHIIKSRITRLFTKWEIKVKDSGDIQALGDSIIKLIAAEAKNQDQKIMLLKYLKEVVFEKKGTAGASVEADSGDMTPERRDELMEMINAAELAKK